MPPRATHTPEFTHGPSTANQGRQNASQIAQNPGVSLTQSFTLNGVTDSDFAKRVIAALEARKSEVERLVSNMVNDAVRLAYGS